MRPGPGLIAGAAALGVALGLLLWREQGAMVWLAGAAVFCG